MLVRPQHLYRRDVIKRPLLDRDRHLRGLARGVYVIREIRVPIAEAVRGVSEPFEIAVGAPPQCLFGNWGLVLERLQLGDLVQQARKVAVFGAGNFGAVIQIGTRGSAGDQRREQYDGQKKTSNPHPTPRGKRELNHLIPDPAWLLMTAVCGGSGFLDSGIS